LPGWLNPSKEEVVMRYAQSIKKWRPPGSAQRPGPWRIALIANLKDEVEWGPEAPPDAGAEFDRHSTVEALARALEADGHWVHICAGDSTLPDVLLSLRPHICFNIAEGIQGDGREAQVPALCELLGIPYTASRVVANALSLDKTRTKRIWRDSGLPTAAFQEFWKGDEALDPALRFPLFVKPSREGTGMGVDPGAVVRDEAALRKRVAWVLSTYRQPALVEELLPGREFTVGFIGNRGQHGRRMRPWLYDAQGYHVFPVLEIDSGIASTPGVYGHDAKSFDIGVNGAPDYLCPARIPEPLRKELVDLTLRASEAIGASDVSRVDFRLGADGRPHLLEINTLPGLNPVISDLCIMAAAEGMVYDDLISEILYLAAERFGLPFEPRPIPEALPARSRQRVRQLARAWGAPVSVQRGGAG
jgi:D-alanine-D-alanine ligase